MRLAVLGSPIEHSLSPTLQSTAYRLLGLDHEYGRREVASGELPDLLNSLDDSWLGLSLTMPLKREVVAMLDSASPLVRQLGVANTVVFSGTGAGRTMAGHNTDVDGITRAISEAHEGRHERVAILGGGATAVSALTAAHELGARSVSAFLRDPSKAQELEAVASALDIAFAVDSLSSAPASGPHDFVISTLPGGVPLPEMTPSSPDAVLLDVAYDPWPSPLASAWRASGATAVSGLDMLVEQAIGQIRLFTGRAQDEPLDGETGIRQAMRESVGLAPSAAGSLDS